MRRAKLNELDRQGLAVAAGLAGMFPSPYVNERRQPERADLRDAVDLLHKAERRWQAGGIDNDHGLDITAVQLCRDRVHALRLKHRL